MAAQLEALFFIDPPEGRTFWTGVLARQAVSRAAGDYLPLGVFHKNEDGSRCQSRAMVRWGGGRRCFRLVGVGQQAASQVHQATLQIARALSRPGNPVRIEVDEAAIHCTLQPIPLRYTLARLVVAKDTAGVDRFWNVFDDAGRKDFIKKAIERGIAAQLEQLANLGEEEDGPEPDDLFISMLAVQVLAISDPMIERISEGKQKRHVETVDVHFEMHARISGNWTAGYMAHLGLGRIQSVDRYHALKTLYRSDQTETDRNHPLTHRRSLKATA